MKKPSKTNSLAASALTLCLVIPAAIGMNAQEQTYWQRQNQLVEAAKHGTSAAVRELLVTGAEAHTRDCMSFCPLHHAADWGNAKTIRPLIEADADPEAHLWHRTTIQHCAYSSLMSVLNGPRKLGLATRVLLELGARMAEEEQPFAPYHW